MHFEKYVCGTGKFVFIIDGHPRDTVGFVNEVVLPMLSKAEEIASQPYSPRGSF